MFMRPTDHREPGEDELIARIREGLIGHEEPYRPGAWEEFSTKKQPGRKPLILWLGAIGSAAAVGLIVAKLFFFNQTQTPDSLIPAQEQPGLTKIEDTGIQKAPETTASETHISKREQIIVYPAVTPGTETQGYAVAQDPEASPVQAIAKNPAYNIANVVPKLEQSASERVARPQEETTTTPVTARRNDIETFLALESARNQAQPKKDASSAADKWEVGVMLAPSVGNAGKLNMGYGLSMAYALSDKVSLSSGLSYNEMAASKGTEDNRLMESPAKTAIASESKSLESVDARVVGIDIPLEVKYRFSEKVYANVGVSAFAVINQRQNNTYIQERLVQNAPTLAGEEDSFKTVIVAEKAREEAPRSEVNQQNYLGFYNFSFGFRQKIAGDKAISIEPFMKVPMKEISKENLRFMGTGLRLKFDF
ncbi:hypothetical protein [Pedobacter faecalis]|uniref:hypothetical protein n=1 Tax=Pedobacter faecalis TaxID=3041495 RepID=UPI00254D1211|nr:hypothetical protein [Pedobacter sp. ELA7]